jgi:hypothetical protein
MRSPPHQGSLARTSRRTNSHLPTAPPSISDRSSVLFLPLRRPFPSSSTALFLSHHRPLVYAAPSLSPAKAPQISCNTLSLLCLSFHVTHLVLFQYVQVLFLFSTLLGTAQVPAPANPFLKKGKDSGTKPPLRSQDVHGTKQVVAIAPILSGARAADSYHERQCDIPIPLSPSPRSLVCGGGSIRYGPGQIRLFPAFVRCRPGRAKRRPVVR